MCVCFKVSEIFTIYYHPPLFHIPKHLCFFFLPFPWCRIGGWFDTTDISIVKFAHGSNSCESTFLSVIMRKDPEKKFYLSRFCITISTCCFWNLHKCKSIQLLILSINNARICQKEETDIQKRSEERKTDRQELTTSRRPEARANCDVSGRVLVSIHEDIRGLFVPLLSFWNVEERKKINSGTICFTSTACFTYLFILGRFTSSEYSNNSGQIQLQFH